MRFVFKSVPGIPDPEVQPESPPSLVAKCRALHPPAADASKRPQTVEAVQVCHDTQSDWEPAACDPSTWMSAEAAQCIAEGRGFVFDGVDLKRRFRAESTEIEGNSPFDAVSWVLEVPVACGMSDSVEVGATTGSVRPTLYVSMCN